MSRLPTIRLTPLNESHLAATLRWVNDSEVMRLMDRGSPVEEEAHLAWFASIRAAEHCAYFAIEAGAESAHVGNVWLWDVDRRHRKAELRVMVGDARVRQQGIGSAAIDQLAEHAFQELGLHRIYAYVLATNSAARRAFERSGFILEGRLRDDRRTSDGFVDAYLLARIAEA